MSLFRQRRFSHSQHLKRSRQLGDIVAQSDDGGKGHGNIAPTAHSLLEDYD